MGILNFSAVKTRNNAEFSGKTLIANIIIDIVIMLSELKTLSKWWGFNT